MSGPLIEASGLHVSAGAAKILSDVDFRVSSGEIVTVVGPNGSGKTTLLRVLVGAMAPDRGSVVRRPGLRVGYVPQRLALDQAMPMTVDRFLGLAERSPDRRRESLARVGVGDVATLQMSALSGGQFQRVLLARALSRRPHLLALDEPTQGLDQPGIAGFYRLIEEMRAELGCGVAMVSHDLHVVMRASDRVVCLNGHVCCEGAPTAVSAAPAYRALFGAEAAGAFALFRHDHDHSHDHAAAPARRTVGAER